MTRGAVNFRRVLAVAAMAAAPSFALERTEVLMGTLAQVEECTAGEDMEDLVERAFARMREIDEELSLYREGSELRKFNERASGWPVRMSWDLCEVLRRARQLSVRTEGAFDVTVLPLMLAHGAYGGLGLGTEASRRLRVGFSGLLLDPVERSGRFLMPGMGIDLGAIGKGFAADEAARVLRAGGSRCGLVDVGGTVRIWGGSGHRWRIGVRDPAEPGSLLGYLALGEGAVATSGNYFRARDGGGGPLRHIFDPRTRRPARTTLGVTVWAEDATTADALSTAFFVLGVERSRHLIAREFRAVSALFAGRRGEREVLWVMGSGRHAWHSLVSQRQPCCPDGRAWRAGGKEVNSTEPRREEGS